MLVIKYDNMFVKMYFGRIKKFEKMRILLLKFVSKVFNRIKNKNRPNVIKDFRYYYRYQIFIINLGHFIMCHYFKFVCNDLS